MRRHDHGHSGFPAAQVMIMNSEIAMSTFLRRSIRLCNAGKLIHSQPATTWVAALPQP